MALNEFVSIMFMFVFGENKTIPLMLVEIVCVVDSIEENPLMEIEVMLTARPWRGRTTPDDETGEDPQGE